MKRSAASLRPLVQQRWHWTACQTKLESRQHFQPPPYSPTLLAQVDDIALEFYELMLEFLRQFLANGGRSSKPFRFMKRRNQDGELLNCSRGSPEAGASSTGLTQIHSDVTVATWRAAPVRTQQPCTQVRDIPKSVHEKTFYSNWCTTRGVAFGFANSTRFSQARRIPVAPQSCHVLPPTRSSFS